MTSTMKVSATEKHAEKLRLKRIRNHQNSTKKSIIFKILFVFGWAIITVFLSLISHRSTLSSPLRKVVYQSLSFFSKSDIPERKGFLTDDDKLLNDLDTSQINAKLSFIYSKKGITFYVLAVTALPKDSIEEFSGKVFARWKPGKKGEDRGILLIIAKEARESRLEVGYGLEGELPDIYCSDILHQADSFFAQSNWALGINSVIDGVATKLGVDSDHSSEGTSSQYHDELKWWQYFAMPFFIFAFVVALLYTSWGQLFFLICTELSWLSLLANSALLYFYLGHSRGRLPNEIFLILMYFFLTLLLVAFWFFHLDDLLSEKMGRGRLGRSASDDLNSSGFGSASGGDFGGASGGGGATSKW